MELVFIFRIIMAVVAGGFLLNAWLKFIRRERSQTIFKLSANSLIWLGIIIFSLFPQATHSISQKLGFGESLNTLIFIGFVIIFMILFKVITMIERIEKNISEMVRNESLNPLRNNQENDRQ